jgi:hypothetical protein
MLSETFWGRGRSLTIGFFGGEKALRERVGRLAREWLDKTNANLDFVFWTAEEVDPYSADIRIAFNPDGGSWSWIGTHARRIAASLPTMNLGWMTLDLEEDRARAVVLHEFGHAIGLIHEHLHPFANIDWNRQQVINDLKRSQGWDEATIAANIFNVPAADQVFATEPDPDSIMMYPIPAHWTRDGTTVGWNTSLSTMDIRLIQSAYGIRNS